MTRPREGSGESAGQFSDRESGKKKVIGQELQARLVFNIKVGDAPQGIAIYLGRLDGGQDDGVIRTYPRGLVDGVRVASLERDIFFGAPDKKCGTQSEPAEAFKIDVAAVHHVEGTSLRNELVEKVDVMGFPFCDADKCEDGSGI